MTDPVRILRNTVKEQRETIEAQQAEIERLKAELESMTGQSESDMKERILRHLATCNKPQTSSSVRVALNAWTVFMPCWMDLASKGLIIRGDTGGEITAAGRDYLASLEAKDVL